MPGGLTGNSAKIILLAFLTILLIMPLSVNATEIKADDAVIVAKGHIIDDDFIATGGTIKIDGTINGDLIVAGGDINVAGTVNGDVIAAGGNIRITGNIADDVRIFGGDMRIEGDVKSDVIAFGGRIELSDESEIGGDLIIGGGMIELNGDVGKGVTGSFGELLGFGGSPARYRMQDAGCRGSSGLVMFAELQ